MQVAQKQVTVKRSTIAFFALGMILLAILVFAPTLSSHRSYSIEPHTLEFGTVGLFDQPQQTLIAQNLSSESLQFKISSDCSCTVIAQPQFSLGPGKKCKIPVVIKHSGNGQLVDGIRHVGVPITVRVGSSQGFFEETCRAQVKFIEPIHVDSSSVVERAQLFSEPEFTIGISAESPGTKVKVSQLPKFCADGRVEWSDEFSSAWLKLKCVPMTKIGSFSDNCELQVTSSRDARIDSIRVPVSVGVDAPISFEPGFAIVSAQGTESQKIVVIQPDSVFQRLAISDIRKKLPPGLDATVLKSPPMQFIIEAATNTLAAPQSTSESEVSWFNGKWNF